jgi:hypothetical protein
MAKTQGMIAFPGAGGLGAALRSGARRAILALGLASAAFVGPPLLPAEPLPAPKAKPSAAASPSPNTAPPGSASSPVEASAARSLPAQVAFVNDQLRRHWAERKVSPSPPATDGQWCRRIYLDVLGRIPRHDELQQFLADPPPKRKQQLVDRLLGDAYVEEYARNWTTLWTNILIGRAGGTERRSLIHREGLQQALRRALQLNVPYDTFAYELMAARGVSKPGAENFNGFVNFMAGNLQDNAIQATAKTSQVFLGLQIQCTQCHNHPFNSWKQNQFWELNAFFRQTRALRRFDTQGGREIESIELINQDFAGENNQPEEALVFYELRNGLTKAAAPVFVDGSKLKSDSGYVDEVDRRTELARLVTSSDYFPAAHVNRLWAHFLGYGFTKPIDDMGPHNPPSHPELLAGLAREFKAAGYDQKALMRWIVLSEAYGVSSRTTDRNQQDDPARGERPLFSHFYLRQMRAEELYESLLVATEAQKSEASYEKQEAAKREWLKQFTVAFGTDDNEETTTFNGTIPQMLMMMNGDLIEKAVNADRGGLLHRLATDARMKNPAKIQHLYLAALARPASREEIRLANELLIEHQGNAVAALQDLWWAVLNCNEFILNH